MLSGSNDFETALGAINEVEVFRYVPKSWDIAELRKIIGLGLARRYQDHESQLGPRWLGAARFPGAEPALRRVAAPGKPGAAAYNNLNSDSPETIMKDFCAASSVNCCCVRSEMALA